MARFTPDSNRQNFTLAQAGREYNLRLLQRAQAIFTALLNLLPSNYVASVQSANYTQELKAVAVELAKIELALEDVNTDLAFQTTRSDFLYSIVGYLLLLNGRLPPLDFSDEEFRNFLLALISIYFQGSTPKSMADVAKLLISGSVTVTENFLLLRQGASGLDISDQFGFNLDVPISGGAFPPNLMAIEATIRMLLDVVRPAHTLYRIRYILSDKYQPNQGVILDALRWHLSAYYYEDFRSYWGGVRDRDRLGKKTNQQVSAEDHSNDF